MTTYTNPYTGQTISPSQIGYEILSITGDTILTWPINGNTTNVVANIIDITASTTNLKLIMPSATQVSNGQTSLINNIGANDIYILKSDLTALATAPAGKAIYIWVTNNTTNAGLWDTLLFGSTTSSVQASALAGYGLTAIGNTLNTATPITTLSTTYTFLPSDRASMYVWTGGAGTVTLPSAASLGTNWFVIIKNDGTGILNVALSGSNTIDGSSGASLQLAESFVVCSNGFNFYSYAYGRSATFFFTQLVLNVTGGTVTLTSTQGANTVQSYQGVLTSNCTIIVPQTVQLYSLQNKTTGSFSLTFSTGVSGGSTLTLTQGQTIIAICDGTNVYNSQTATSSTINSLTLGNGSASAPSLSFIGDATTGLYLQASNQLGFAVAGVKAGTLTSTGLLMPVGINGGAF